MPEQVVAPNNCSVCKLPQELKNALHRKLLGDPGDITATPPRMPVGAMSTPKVSEWLMTEHGVNIGYKSICRHRTAHIVFLPATKAPLADAVANHAPVTGNDLLQASIAADPAITAALAQNLTDTRRIDKAADFLVDLLETVGAAVKKRAIHRATHRIGQPQNGQSTAFGADREEATITKAESDFFTGGFGALAQLEKAKLAVGIGKTDGRGKVNEALAVAAGVKGLLFGTAPPPIDGDEPDEDEAADAPIPVAANAPVIDVDAVVLSEPGQPDAQPASTSLAVTQPAPATAAPPLRSITGGAGKIGLWIPPAKRTGM